MLAQLQLGFPTVHDGLVGGDLRPPRGPLQHLALLQDAAPEVSVELQETHTHTQALEQRFLSG